MGFYKKEKSQWPDLVSDRYGDLAGYYLGPVPLVVVSNPDTLKKVFKMDEAAGRNTPKPFHKLRFGGDDGLAHGMLFRY